MFFVINLILKNKTANENHVEHDKLLIKQRVNELIEKQQILIHYSMIHESWQ